MAKMMISLLAFTMFGLSARAESMDYIHVRDVDGKQQATFLLSSTGNFANFEFEQISIRTFNDSEAELDGLPEIFSKEGKLYFRKDGVKVLISDEIVDSSFGNIWKIASDIQIQRSDSKVERCSAKGYLTGWDGGLGLDYWQIARSYYQVESVSGQVLMEFDALFMTGSLKGSVFGPSKECQKNLISPYQTFIRGGFNPVTGQKPLSN